MTQHEIVVAATADLVALETARRFEALLDAQDDGVRIWHIAVSGGSFATHIFPHLVDVMDAHEGFAPRVHVWFADERWLPVGDPERNSTPIGAALASLTGFDAAAQFHPLESSADGSSLDEACVRYAAELGDAVDHLDLVFLGAGPDGHTASLFPGTVDHMRAGRGTIAVIDSPKPPRERMSLTLAELCAADRIWAVVTGAGKAEAVALATRSHDATRTPLGAARGVLESVLLLDEAAAALLG